jgi:sugar lactone lactonase YvrE
MPARKASSLTFGGPDYSDLYITKMDRYPIGAFSRDLWRLQLPRTFQQAAIAPGTSRRSTRPTGTRPSQFSSG